METIKLFVSCHKKFEIPACKELYPVQAGAALNRKIDGFLHDDVGDNISTKNKKYCEVSVQYYAWKNETADYYGFMHYRRYFCFNDKPYPTNACHEIEVPDFNGFAQEFGYDSANLQQQICGWDLILPKRQPMMGARFHYGLFPHQDGADLDFCIRYIREHYPQMRRAIRKYNHSFNGYFCNQFIMKKQLFFDYCAWLFEILAAHEAYQPHTYADTQKYRVEGYLAERLFGYYVTWLKENPNLKIKELRRVVIANPMPTEPPAPLAEKTFVLPVTAASLAEVGIVVQSLANSQTNAELFLLHNGLQPAWLNALTAQATEGLKIRTLPCRAGTRMQLLRDLPTLLPRHRHVFLLSPSCLVRKDLDAQLQDAAIAGVIDTDLVALAQRKKSIARKLKKHGVDPYCPVAEEYLELNLPKLREVLQSLPKNAAFVQLTAAAKPQLLPQARCRKFDSMYLNNKYYFTYLPHDLYDDWVQSKDCAIVNFNGFYPPQKTDLCDFGTEYWQTARRSPFYEQALSQYVWALPSRKEKRLTKRRARLDKFFPSGTYRREFLKMLNKKYFDR